MAIPGDHQEGGTLIIPGHGRICDEADLALYQQMVTIVRDRLQDMIKKGMTLEQIKAAKPTQDFDPIYGKKGGNWTTDMFIEAAYKSLTSKRTLTRAGTDRRAALRSHIQRLTEPLGMKTRGRKILRRAGGMLACAAVLLLAGGGRLAAQIPRDQIGVQQRPRKRRGRRRRRISRATGYRWSPNCGATG